MTKTPIWRSISEALRAGIADGHYPTGAKLPTEAELSRRFGVNRHTVRRALADLSENGLVHARRGSGVYVLAQPLDYPLSQRVRYHQNLLAAGRIPEKTQLAVEVRGASENDSKRLRIAAGEEVAVAHYISYADHVPVALTESRFPEARFPGLAAALRHCSRVTQALNSVGVKDYTRASTRLIATTATAAQGLHLRIHEGAPLLLTQALSLDDTGLPVEYGQTWFASERITLTLDHIAERAPDTRP